MMSKIATTRKAAPCAAPVIEHAGARARIDARTCAIRGSLIRAGEVARGLIHDDVMRRLCRARELMHAHHAEPLRLDALAREAGLSRYHFLRTFRDAFGTTPHEYLTRVRLDRAKRLLAADEGTVTSVCFDVGFRSLGSFSTLFAERVGCPPSAWRKHVWQVQQAISAPPIIVPWCFYTRFGAAA
jgi:AraC-like DNA-binding protein